MISKFRAELSTNIIYLLQFKIQGNLQKQGFVYGIEEKSKKFVVFQSPFAFIYFLTRFKMGYSSPNDARSGVNQSQAFFLQTTYLGILIL